jgi:acetyl esterase/lipase
MPLISTELARRGGGERLAALLLRTALRITVRPVLSPRISIKRQRWWLRRIALMGRPTPGQQTVEAGKVGGVSGEWIRPLQLSAATERGATILYLHGGAYCVGAPATHRAITLQLGRRSRMPVFAADYRLAPEHPFPAAVDDAVSVCRSLLEMGPLVIAGDSAGGGLAVATALAIQQNHIGTPAALVLFSPWIDLSSPLITAGGKRNVMLSHRWLDACARHYTAGRDLKSPLASPIYGDLRGLPPTLIQAGTDDLLHPQSVRLHDAMRDAGVLVRCEIVSNYWHVFQLHAGVLSAADDALARASEFIESNIPPVQRERTLTGHADCA